MNAPSAPRTSARSEAWPSLAVDDWTRTRETLHMWLQIVGKVRMARAPMLNHWWQVPFYVSARGLTTSSMPHGDDVFDMEFDLVAEVLRIRSSRGGTREVRLEPKPVAVFYRQVMDALADLDLGVSIMATPVEVEHAIPFERDHEHAAYDPEHARLFWRQLRAADRVMNEFRSRFYGKSSPVHFFWGAMDLACTRFSGRAAPQHPGGAPNCADWVMVEGYSHELYSCGFWPGGSAEGSFYAYAYPEPDGFATHPVRPQVAAYSAGMGEYLLPYDAARSAADPDEAVLEFLQTTYEAAADNAGWDREALEAHPHRHVLPF
ncbi:hypothetical protein LY13_001132 [Prauserella aidingensis]|uniref:DUF5996 family protein n=1 Tax=Prauserella aidingensis TaxID=387890 RepID=UPI0020A24B29|nr:DUF5996 family protein [Prauserella aidingensis]MCP2252393.1 hypothetical protein [Prauserella aidingensis]